MRERLEEISSLRFLMLIGSPVGYGHCTEFTKMWSKKLGRTSVASQSYGMTEYACPTPIPSRANIPKARSIDNKNGKILLFATIEAKAVNTNGEEVVPRGTDGGATYPRSGCCQGLLAKPQSDRKAIREGWMTEDRGCCHG